MEFVYIINFSMPKQILDELIIKQTNKENYLESLIESFPWCQGQ